MQRVVAYEDDILSKRKPPNGLWLDTKAEENGWEVPPLVLGRTDVSQQLHTPPHGMKPALTYMMNTLCTEADLHDTPAWLTEKP